MATLRTDYINDILAAAMDGKRQYQMINNPNGTVSFVDVTQYDQNGDTFSAGDVNGIDTQINTNTADIATNASNIATNTANIETNTRNISTNASNISSVRTELREVELTRLNDTLDNSWGSTIKKSGFYYRYYTYSSAYTIDLYFVVYIDSQNGGVINLDINSTTPRLYARLMNSGTWLPWRFVNMESQS